MEWISEFLIPVLVASIPATIALIGTLAGVRAQLKQSEDNAEKSRQKIEAERKREDEIRQQRQEEVLRCLLRTALLNMYFKHVEKQNFKLSQWEAENMHKMFASYRALDGNSFVIDLVNRMNAWEIVQN